MSANSEPASSPPYDLNQTVTSVRDVRGTSVAHQHLRTTVESDEA